MSENEEYERIKIGRLSWCNKCDNSILNGIKIENKMYTFCLCEECIKTEKIPRKNKDTKHIKINEKIHTINISDVSIIHNECSTNLHGGSEIYIYDVVMSHKYCGTVCFRMHIDDLCAILHAMGETKFYNSFLENNYKKYICKNIFYKVGDKCKLMDNCYLCIDKIYEAAVLKKVEIEYDVKIETELISFIENKSIRIIK